METLPPVTLGAIIGVSFAGSWLVRQPLRRFFVLAAPRAGQTRRQFTLDFSLCILLGALAAAYNNAAFDFPLGSGISLIAGYAIAGFFIALDMALSRERGLIHEAYSANQVLPPKEFYPMTRRFSIVALVSAFFIVVILGMVISKDLGWLSKIGDDPLSLSRARMSVFYEILFIMAALLVQVVNLIFSFSRNLQLLFRNETGVLERVSRGDLSELVPVATSDEFGLIAGHTNTMIHGLRDRTRLLTALKVAEEVQQNLLPLSPPHADGLEIAGKSIYCDETGGDYYDYLELANGRLAVAVADAADHGVGSALHMTTARAFLRFGARNARNPAWLVGEVNRFLTRDSRDSGRFMTLFFLEIDPAVKSLRWVRAGHDPAILYDPAADSFTELAGDGMALGVIEDFSYTEYHHPNWKPGSVVVVVTDGIRETRNTADQMFGTGRLREIIRSMAAASADSILNAIIADLTEFRGAAAQQDDITLVVLKLM